MTTNLVIGKGKQQLKPLEHQSKAEKSKEKFQSKLKGKPPTQGELKARIIGAIAGIDGKLADMQHLCQDISTRIATSAATNTHIRNSEFVDIQTLKQLHEIKELFDENFKDINPIRKKIILITQDLKERDATGLPF